MSTGERPSSQRDLILRCRQGDQAALGDLLHQHRDWLKNAAATALNGRASGRIDASDIVQQTLLSAFNRFEQFEGATSGEFAAWLARIHERNIQDSLRRHVGALKRSTEVERRFAPKSAAADDVSDPRDHAIRNEQGDQLMRYLGSLPVDQAEAVRLRHLQGWSLGQLQAHFDRSRDAVASLLKRGVANLRKQIEEDEAKDEG